MEDLSPQAKVRSRQERRPGEETRPLFPALSSRVETPCPSESSWSPQDGQTGSLRAPGGLVGLSQPCPQ